MYSFFLLYVMFDFNLLIQIFMQKNCFEKSLFFNFFFNQTPDQITPFNFHFL